MLGTCTTYKTLLSRPHLTHTPTHTGTLKGMHETSGKLTSPSDATTARTAVMEAANVAQVPCVDPQMLKFASATFAAGLPVLVTVQLGSKVTVNSEKMVINSMLLKTIKAAVDNS